jgi:hypothetical protein
MPEPKIRTASLEGMQIVSDGETCYLPARIRFFGQSMASQGSIAMASPSRPRRRMADRMERR